MESCTVRRTQGMRQAKMHHARSREPLAFSNASFSDHLLPVHVVSPIRRSCETHTTLAAPFT